MLPNRTAWMVLAMCTAMGAGCTAEQEEAQPVVSFKADVQPILNRNCVICHRPSAEGYKANGLDLTSYDGIMKGKRNGPVIEPGSSRTSVLVRAINWDAKPPIVMPHRNPPLPKKDVQIIQAWVDQGARDN